MISVPDTQSIPVQVFPAHWLNRGDQTTFQITLLSSRHSHFITNSSISHLPIISISLLKICYTNSHSAPYSPTPKAVDWFIVIIDCTQSLMDQPHFPPHLVRVLSARPRAALQPPAPLPSLRGGSPSSVACVCATQSVGDIPSVCSSRLLPFHFSCAVPQAQHADRARPPRSFPKVTKNAPFFSPPTHHSPHQPSSAIKLPRVNARARRCGEAVR